jgi:plastocyanin
MKKFFGFCILVILLVAISGCAQQAAQTTPATTSPTTVATTIVTTLATTEPTPAPTTMVTTLPVATNATIEPTLVGMNVTTMAPALTTSTPRADLTAQTKITTISISNNTFTPKVLTVLPGTGITWKNDDNVIHAVKVIGAHAGMFNSGDIIPGSSWSYTFNQNVDTYEIGDPNFPQMNSTIVVKNGQDFSGLF